MAWPGGFDRQGLDRHGMVRDTRYAVVSFVQQGARMVAEDIHYLETLEQAKGLAKFISGRRPGVLVLSVSAAPESEDPEIQVLEQIGAGLAGAVATVH